jgi:hypothetical protein
MVLHAATVLVTVTVMAPLAVTDLHVLQAIVLLTVIVATAMPVQNEVALVAVVPTEHPEASVQAETVEGALHLETETIVRSVQIVPPTVIDHSEVNAHPMVIEVHVQNVVNAHPMVIVPNAVTVPVTEIVMAHPVVSAPTMVIVVPVRTVVETALHTVIVVHDLSVQSVLPTETVRSVTIVHNEVIVPPIVIVRNVHVLATAEVVRIVLVLHVLEVVKSVFAGRNQNLLKSSAWRANFAWFVHTTTTPGSMTMSPVMNSTRSHVMS